MAWRSGSSCKRSGIGRASKLAHCCHIDTVACEDFVVERQPFRRAHKPETHLLAVGPLVPTITSGSLCVAQRLSFKIRAGHVVEEELETYTKQVPVTLHEVLAEPVLVLSKLIKPPVEPFVVDEFRGDAAQIFQSSPRIPFLGHAKLRGLPAELAGCQHDGHLRPSHGFATAVHQFGKQVVEAKPSPECQGQKHAAKFTHPLDGEIGQVGQFPLRAGGRVWGVICLLKQKLPRRRLAALQQGFDILSTRGKILLREFALRRDDVPPRAQFGAYRLAQCPVFVDLAIGAFAVLAQKPHLVRCSSAFVNLE
jgi:hypothetical protein